MRQGSLASPLGRRGIVSILPPDGSLTFIVAVAGPLILGFLLGIVLKSALKIGIALVVIIALVTAIGIVLPNQLIGGLVSPFRTGQSLTIKVGQIGGYLPYSSVTFVIGLVIGFFKG